MKIQHKKIKSEENPPHLCYVMKYAYSCMNKNGNYLFLIKSNFNWDRAPLPGPTPQQKSSQKFTFTFTSYCKSVLCKTHSFFRKNCIIEKPLWSEYEKKHPVSRSHVSDTQRRRAVLLNSMQSSRVIDGVNHIPKPLPPKLMGNAEQVLQRVFVTSH